MPAMLLRALQRSLLEARFRLFRAALASCARVFLGFETEKEGVCERQYERRIDARKGAHATSVHQRCLPEGFYRSCEVHEPYARESALALDLRDACSAGRVLRS